MVGASAITRYEGQRFAGWADGVVGIRAFDYPNCEEKEAKAPKQLLLRETGLLGQHRWNLAAGRCRADFHQRERVRVQSEGWLRPSPREQSYSRIAQS